MSLIIYLSKALNSTERMEEISMKRGLTVTLMMVAIALIGYRSMAFAPVISDIPSPIIADDAPVSGANHFVYPDAINLDLYVSDDGGAANVIWSYVESSGTYQLNGVATLNLATDNPTSPGAKAISTQVLNSEENPDTNARTVTLRNVHLSPFAGPDTAPNPDVAGIVAAETKVVTLFASDGATHSLGKDLLVYTDNNGVDRLSTGVAAPDTTINFLTGTNNWVYALGFGTMSSSTVGGICLEAPLTGVNFANWSSPYQIINLVDNAVFRIRLTVDSTQTTAFKNPLWDIVYDSFATNPAERQDAYGGDFFFLDNEGGANAPGTLGRTEFEVWAAPIPVAAPSWRANAFTTAMEPSNDMRLIFRILDADGAGYGAETDLGRICLKSLDITKFDITNDLQEGAVVFNAATITNAATDNPLTATSFSATGLVGTTATFASGAVTITPTDSNGWTNEISKIEPGDTTVNTSTGAGLTDNWPITWENQTLYKAEVQVSAPDATGESNPPDAIRFGMDTPTTELIYLAHITPNMNRAGTPKQGTPQTYTSFFFSHNLSLTTIPNAKALRPRMDCLDGDALQANGFTTNKGGVKVSSMKVTKMTVK
jgi:hypothetical protein